MVQKSPEQKNTSNQLIPKTSCLQPINRWGRRGIMDGDPWSGDGILSTSFPNTVFITASVSSQRGRSSDGSTVSLVALLVSATVPFDSNDCDCDYNPNFDCDSDRSDYETIELE
eukprot:54967_1